ncbi:hypothetical protein [Aminobacter sp. BE322]|uniref:hypothetical protein n=1 Tax=unclassified Aminobacter TaxID=2644704 RepID=UPI003D2543A4
MTAPADLEAALVAILTAPDDARRALVARLGGYDGTAEVPIRLTVPKFAGLYGVDERTVWRWIAKGQVDVHRDPGGRTFVEVSRTAPTARCRNMS